MMEIQQEIGLFLVELPGQSYEMYVLDIANLDKPHNYMMTKRLQASPVIVIVIDLNDRSTFESVANVSKPQDSPT